MKNEENISCGLSEHKTHMCALQAAGNTAELQRLSSHPTVTCGVCGAKANRADNVCTPAGVFDDEQIA
ncbi:hypothetical protein LPW11_12300 [Geomonas sp. RF6]|uniref:hypothetical protein n=1 Tax=Geomonas sp. RF6 TaxID=2897342 RepID=UPI001E4FE376|nr:hypothetical protein [Geomonas sp. RF6]UFS68691.1 hypothetical protein LPW11_12300 [Geomonas sp. RF6]